MNPLTLIFLFALGIAILYLGIYTLASIFSQKTLFKNGKAFFAENTIQIYASADALEYDLRLAIAASSFRHTEIIVNIPINDAHREEMLETIRMMRRRYKNISYQLTGKKG